MRSRRAAREKRFHLDWPVFIHGLDLGKVGDPTAHLILERKGVGELGSYELRHAHRFVLGTPYQAIADHVFRVWHAPKKSANRMFTVHEQRQYLVADATGVGDGVVEILDSKKLEPIPITITGGFDPTRTKRPFGGFGWRVPKRDLATAVHILLHSARLTISRQLAEAETIKKELLNFRIKVTKAGNDTYEAWREGDHDDMVLGLAVGAWWGENAYVDDVEDQSSDNVEPRPLGDFDDY